MREPALPNRTPRIARRVSALVALAAAATAVATAGALAGARQAQLTVLAASSLTNVLPQIDSAPRYSFAGSDTLAGQLRLGAPADVFAAANTSLPAALYQAGLVEKPVVFAANRLVLITPRSNPAGIASVYDLRRPGVKLIVGAPTVPIGAYTRTVLRNLATYGLIVMGVFLIVLLVPFAYLLSTGALEWGPIKQGLSRAGAGVLRAAGAPGRTGLDPADSRDREGVEELPGKAA